MSEIAKVLLGQDKKCQEIKFDFSPFKYNQPMTQRKRVSLDPNIMVREQLINEFIDTKPFQAKKELFYRGSLFKDKVPMSYFHKYRPQVIQLQESSPKALDEYLPYQQSKRQISLDSSKKQLHVPYQPIENTLSPEEKTLLKELSFPPLKLNSEDKNQTKLSKLEKETAVFYEIEKKDAEKYLQDSEKQYLKKFTLPDFNTGNKGARLNLRTNFRNYKRQTRNMNGFLTGRRNSTLELRNKFDGMPQLDTNRSLISTDQNTQSKKNIMARNQDLNSFVMMLKQQKLNQKRHSSEMRQYSTEQVHFPMENFYEQDLKREKRDILKELRTQRDRIDQEIKRMRISAKAIENYMSSKEGFEKIPHNIRDN